MSEKEQYSNTSENIAEEFDLGSEAIDEIIEVEESSKNKHRDFGLAVGKILTSETGEDILGARQGRLDRISEHQKEELILREEKKLKEEHKRAGRKDAFNDTKFEDTLRKIATAGALSVFRSISQQMHDETVQQKTREANRKAARKEYLQKKTASSFQAVIGKSNKIGEQVVAEKMSKAAMALMNNEEFAGNEDFAI